MNRTINHFVYAIGMDVAKHDRNAQMRIAAVMKRLRWEHQRRKWVTGEGRERRWVRPASMQDTPPADARTRSASNALDAGGDDVPF